MRNVVLRCGTSVLFGAKNFRFFEFFVCHTDREVEPVRTGGKRGSIFRNFVRTSVMDDPLIVFKFNLAHI